MEEKQNQIPSILLINGQQLTYYSILKKFKCLKNNQALYVCSEQQCCKNVIICSQKFCQCQQIHSNCKIILFRRVIKNILLKSKQLSKETKQSYQTLYQQINIMIDELSLLKQKIKIQQQTFQLLEEQKILVQLIKNDKIEEVSGKLINLIDKTKKSKQIDYIISSKSIILIQMEKYRQQLNKICKSIQQKLMKRCKQSCFGYKFLDIQNKRLRSYLNFDNQQLKQFLKFKFIPINVNQNIGQFKDGYYKIINQKMFQRIKDNNQHRQVSSIQELPINGKYYFQLYCHKSNNNHTMVGIATENCLNNQNSYCNLQSLCYYAHDGLLYQNCSYKQLGRPLRQNKGLVSVLLDMDNKDIHWCIDNQYQGKTKINQNFQDRKIFAYVDSYVEGTIREFINQFNLQKEIKIYK